MCAQMHGCKNNEIKEGTSPVPMHRSACHGFIPFRMRGDTVMKKHISMLLTLLLLFSIVACAEPTPKIFGGGV